MIALTKKVDAKMCEFRLTISLSQRITKLIIWRLMIRIRSRIALETVKHWFCTNAIFMFRMLLIRAREMHKSL